MTPPLVAPVDESDTTSTVHCNDPQQKRIRRQSTKLRNSVVMSTIGQEDLELNSNQLEQVSAHWRLQLKQVYNGIFENVIGELVSRFGTESLSNDISAAASALLPACPDFLSQQALIPLTKLLQQASYDISDLFRGELCVAKTLLDSVYAVPIKQFTGYYTDFAQTCYQDL